MEMRRELLKRGHFAKPFPSPRLMHDMLCLRIRLLALHDLDALLYQIYSFITSVWQECQIVVWDLLIRFLFMLWTAIPPAELLKWRLPVKK